MYLELLKKWSASDLDNMKLQAVLKYVSKGRTIEDLVTAKILHCAFDGSEQPALANQRPESGSKQDKSKFDIFSLLPGGFDKDGKYKPWQADAFIRWSIEIPDVLHSEVWSDKELWDLWQKYYRSLKPDKGLCYVTGEETTLADMHPAKIRNDGDKAKLISSGKTKDKNGKIKVNDNCGYTFSGRFTTSDEACGVSFDSTQKAHNALRWLISRQGKKGVQSVIAWAVSGADIPDPFADTYSLVSGDTNEEAPKKDCYTAQEFGTAFSKRIEGYSKAIGPTDDIVVMALDSATPGRMAITFYRELTGSDLIARVEEWHSGCKWHQDYGNGVVFDGAPSPKDIAEVAFGTWRDKKMHIDEKLRKATVERLLPCIVDRTPIPRDLVVSCVRRASNRNGIERWAWEKALGIACALYRHHNTERRYDMALEKDRTTRDYLYGRLLAMAERLESDALRLADENRETNAARLMQRFADRPYSTWRTIELSLAPYKSRLRSRQAGWLYLLEKEIDNIICSFGADDFISDKGLSGEFLIGYHCQRSARLGKEGKKDQDAESMKSNEEINEGGE
jgi:CRISPR-associated protein Csd1